MEYEPGVLNQDTKTLGRAVAHGVERLAGAGTTIVLGEDAEVWECSFAIATGSLRQRKLAVYQWSE